MLFVKSIWGILSHEGQIIQEGGIATFEKTDHIIQNWERKGFCKTFDTYEAAEAFQFKGMAERAAESLASLNPPTDAKGNLIPVPAPTIDFEKGLPINPVEEVKLEPKKADPKTGTNKPE